MISAKTSDAHEIGEGVVAPAPNENPGPDASPAIREVDEALVAEDEAKSIGRSTPQRVPNESRITLPTVLRVVGSTLLCAAALVFMVQRWDGANDVQRYYHFLAFTGVVTAAGLFCGLRLREDKSARTFLGLVSAIVPAHFAVLGALLYSQYTWISGHVPYPGYAHIVAPSLGVAVRTIAVGVALLTPAIFLAMRVLIGRHALSTTLAYLAANSVLLVPTRDPDVVALVVLATTLFVAVFQRRFSGETALKTFEGRLVRVMLAAPPVVLLARSIHLHGASWLLLAAIAGLVSYVLFSLVPKTCVRWPVIARNSQRLSSLAVLATSSCLALAMWQRWGIPESVLFPLALFPGALALMLLSFRALDEGAVFRPLAAAAAVSGAAAQVVVFPGFGSSLLCVVTSIAIIGYGCAMEQKSVLLVGVIAFLFAICDHVGYAIELYAMSPWLSLATLGLITVLAAAVIERYGSRLRTGGRAFRTRFAQWQV